MGDKSAIHWTDATWNPLVGCSRVSEGCRNCYAEREAATRLAQTPKYRGLAREVNGHPSWTGEVRLWEPHLDQPLRWQAPRRIFVNSMSDLFHEKVPDEWIIKIFTIMEAASWHTFQVLTKRAERMRAILSHPQFPDAVRKAGYDWLGPKRYNERGPHWRNNIWLGVSVEDQETADERIPLLLQTPAVVRWVSYEPALALANFGMCLSRTNMPILSMMPGFRDPLSGIDWLVVGGESGPEARPFDLAWARETIAQCRAAGVPAFFKQAGRHPILDGQPLTLKDRKGGDLAELPAEFHVREYPNAT